MINLILYLMVSYGITTIVTQSKIFAWLRNWAESKSDYWSGVIRCPMCFGFWCGIFLSLTLFNPIGFYIGGKFFLTTFFDGCLSSGVNNMLYAIHHKLWPDW